MKELGKRSLYSKFILIVLCSFFIVSNLNGQRLRAGYTNEKRYAKDFVRSNGYFLKGKALFKKGKIKKAESLLKECLTIFPGHDQAYYFLSMIFYNQGKYRSAEKCIREAQRYFRLKRKLWDNIHVYHITKLKNQRSELVGIMNPTDAEVRRIQELNLMINDSGYKKEKIPSNYPYMNGNILLKLKKYKEAHQKYLETLKIDPNHAKASNNLATLYFMIKEYEKAREYLANAEKNGLKINIKFKNAIEHAIKQKGE